MQSTNSNSLKIHQLLFALLIFPFALHAQNVGIGTNTPLNKLSVNGNADISGRLFLNTNNNVADERITIRSGSDSFGLIHTDGKISLATWVGSLGVTGGWLGTFSRHNLFFFTDNGGAQAVIDTNGNAGFGTANPNKTSVLEASSTTKGFLPPRMTTAQKNAINNPPEGLEVYDLTLHQKSYYNGSAWVSLATPSTTAVFLPTIVIGTQQWMSKNLDVAFYRNGDPIPQVTDPAAWFALTTGAWCYYNNDSTLGNNYGKLYNWYAVNDPRGLAPQGWHIPSDAEWTALETTLGGSSVAGGKMKEPGTLNWRTPNTGANNNSGWLGLPGSGRASNGTFVSSIGFIGNWWSSTGGSTTNPVYRLLGFDNGGLARYGDNRRNGFSVRCIRD